MVQMSALGAGPQLEIIPKGSLILTFSTLGCTVNAVRDASSNTLAAGGAGMPAV